MGLRGDNDDSLCFGLCKGACGRWRLLADAAAAIDWVTPPTTAIDSRNAPFHRWFPDGEMNTCHNAVDRHVAAGRGEQNAIIYDSPITGTAYNLTFAELQRYDGALAGMLNQYGVGTGDRGNHLYADDPRGGYRHVAAPAWCCPFGCLSLVGLLRPSSLSVLMIASRG